MTRACPILFVVAGVGLSLVNVQAADPPANKPAASAPAVEMNELEQAFVELMKGSQLTGKFTVEGHDDDAKTDSYRINAVSKVKDDNWVVHSRIKYGDLDVVVPIPVQMNWAGDTAVLSVTDLAIPGMGEGFSSRLLFDGQRYAGTWAHGKVGGHMWGKIEKQPADAEKKPESK
jgi:hypothetical protein